MNEDKSCPIELAAQLLIDKWSVVILRDIAFFNRLSFRDILTKNLENISSSTLSSRLKRLQDLNLLTRKDDLHHAQKRLYYLTEGSIQLVPMLIQMAIWTSKFRNPSVEILNLLEPIMSENNSHLDGMLEGLLEIHLLGQSKDPFWWRALTTQRCRLILRT